MEPHSCRQEDKLTLRSVLYRMDPSRPQGTLPSRLRIQLPLQPVSMHQSQNQRKRTRLPEPEPLWRTRLFALNLGSKPYHTCRVVFLSFAMYVAIDTNSHCKRSIVTKASFHLGFFPAASHLTESDSIRSFSVRVRLCQTTFVTWSGARV